MNFKKSLHWENHNAFLRVKKRQHKRCWSFFWKSNHSLSNDPYLPSFISPPPSSSFSSLQTQTITSLTSTGTQCGEGGGNATGETKKKNPHRLQIVINILLKKKKRVYLLVFEQRIEHYGKLVLLGERRADAAGTDLTDWLTGLLSPGLFVCKALALDAVGNMKLDVQYHTADVKKTKTTTLWRDIRCD